MKNALVVLVVLAGVILAGCSSIPKGGAPAPAAPQAQAAPALTGDSFTGTIVTYQMKGSMAKPHLLAEVKGEDGRTAWFNLRKSAAVTDVRGKPIGFMRGFKKGRKVEITFAVKDGQNEALSWHYLD